MRYDLARLDSEVLNRFSSRGKVFLSFLNRPCSAFTSTSLCWSARLCTIRSIFASFVLFDGGMDRCLHTASTLMRDFPWPPGLTLCLNLEIASTVAPRYEASSASTSISSRVVATELLELIACEMCDLR